MGEKETITVTNCAGQATQSTSAFPVCCQCPHLCSHTAPGACIVQALSARCKGGPGGAAGVAAGDAAVTRELLP